MRTLAFDTTLGACSVAVLEDGQVAARCHRALKRGHAEALLPMIEAAMGSAKLGYHDLDLLAVTVGPGTFTGLRIGLATARGLALAAGLPLVGLTSLQVLAAPVLLTGSVKPGAGILVAVDARRGEAYCQVFADDFRAVTAPMVLSIEVLTDLDMPADLQVIGTAADAAVSRLCRQGIKARLADTAAQPDAVWLARMAERQGIPAEPGLVAPLYIRAPDATLPKPSA